MKIYGWREQNEASWGVESAEIDSIEIEKVSDDGRVIATCLPNGQWYVRFSSAKAAALEFWKRRIEIAKIAIKDIRSITKNDFGT